MKKPKTSKPETLGDYRDICAIIGGETCAAVKFLDRKIAEQGRDELVLADESQMLMLLGPMLLVEEEIDVDAKMGGAGP